MGDEEITVKPIELTHVKSFLVIDDGKILIDVGNPGDGPQLSKRIKKMGYSLNEISLIVITHVHQDHVGGLEQLKEATGADVAVHSNGAEFLKEGRNQPVVPRGIKGKILSHLIPSKKSMDRIEPDIVIGDEFDLRDHGIRGKVISTPGHTEDSLSVLLDEDKIIIGDLVMGGLLRSKKAGLPMFAYDIDEVKRSLKKIISKEPEKIYTSHGGPFEPGGLKKLL